MVHDPVRRLASLAVVALTLLWTGCPESAKSPTPAPAPTTTAPAAPLIQPKQALDWCKEHGVPESACTRCNAELIAQFKAKSDWCETHGLPKSQCVACDPSVQAKLDALKPAGM